MNQFLQVILLVLLVVLVGVAVAALFEWRLRAHLGDARKIVSSLRAHVDGFEAAWEGLRRANEANSNRLDLMKQEIDPIRQDVNRHEEILRKLRLT